MHLALLWMFPLKVYTIPFRGIEVIRCHSNLSYHKMLLNVFAFLARNCHFNPLALMLSMQGGLFLLFQFMIRLESRLLLRLISLFFSALHFLFSLESNLKPEGVVHSLFFCSDEPVVYCYSVCMAIWKTKQNNDAVILTGFRQRVQLEGFFSLS